MTNQYTVCRVKYMENKWNINVRMMPVSERGLVIPDASKEQASASPTSSQRPGSRRCTCDVTDNCVSNSLGKPYLSHHCAYAVSFAGNLGDLLAFQKNSLCFKAHLKYPLFCRLYCLASYLFLDHLP